MLWDTAVPNFALIRAAVFPLKSLPRPLHARTINDRGKISSKWYFGGRWPGNRSSSCSFVRITLLLPPSKVDRAVCSWERLDSAERGEVTGAGNRVFVVEYPVPERECGSDTDIFTPEDGPLELPDDGPSSPVSEYSPLREGLPAGNA